MIIATATPKGGEGKSTTCYFLGNALVRRGFKILFVDMDPQNSLTYLLFERYNVKYDDVSCDIAKFLVDPERNSPYKLDNNLDVIPSTFALASQRTIGKGVLKSKLDKIKSNYDFIIIDTAPSYDNFFITTCNASDVVIYPIFIKSVLSFKTFVISVNLMLEENHTDILEKTRLLCTKFYNTDGELQNMQVLRNFINDDEDTLFYKTKIPFSKKIINVQNSNKLQGKLSDEVFRYYDILIDEIFNDHKIYLDRLSSINHANSKVQSNIHVVEGEDEDEIAKNIHAHEMNERRIVRPNRRHVDIHGDHDVFPAELGLNQLPDGSYAYPDDVPADVVGDPDDDDFSTL